MTECINALIIKCQRIFAWLRKIIEAKIILQIIPRFNSSLSLLFVSLASRKRIIIEREVLLNLTWFLPKERLHYSSEKILVNECDN